MKVNIQKELVLIFLKLITLRAVKFIFCDIQV